MQLIDTKERLFTLQKSDVREFTWIKSSSMPSYRDKLTASTSAPISIAYLLSLKGLNQVNARSFRRCSRSGHRRPVGSQLRAGHARSPARLRRSEPHNWLTYGGTYSSQRYTTLDQITPANVRAARIEVGLSVAPARSVRDNAARRRRHSLHRAGKRRRRARCGHRSAVLDVPPPADARSRSMLRAHQPRRGDT